MGKISNATEMLVPLDDREAGLRSVPVAGRIARRLGLPLHLVGVSDEPDAIRSWLTSQAEKLLPETPVTITAAQGDAADVIVDAAGADGLVCMATAATLRPHHGHFGSVAEAVVRRVERPVILLGPHADLDPGDPTDRIVVPVDGSEISERALGVAADFAAALGVEVWVVTVVSPKTEAAARREVGVVSAGASSGYVRRLAAEVAETHGVSTEYEVLHIEDPAEAIVDFSGDDGTVVMSTHGRSGLSRLFAGSVARGVVARSSRPVIVCRPADAD